MDPEIGTIYSVAVPVRRVKPALRPAMAEGGGGGGGGGAAGAVSAAAAALARVLARSLVRAPARRPLALLPHARGSAVPGSVEGVCADADAARPFCVALSFLQWDPNDPDSDPSDQFPWGT
jgi:hypothetical protein